MWFNANVDYCMRFRKFQPLLSKKSSQNEKKKRNVDSDLTDKAFTTSAIHSNDSGSSRWFQKLAFCMFFWFDCNQLGIN